MVFYVIRNKKTGQLVAGTDFNFTPPRQIYASAYRPPLLLSVEPKMYSPELRKRQIRLRTFELVCVDVIENRDERNSPENRKGEGRAACGIGHAHARNGF